jgi:IclR helix-turn-helix domain
MPAVREEPDVEIELSSAQVARVLRATGGEDVVAHLLAILRHSDWAPTIPSESDPHSHGVADGRLSSSLLLGLRVLAALPRDGRHIGVVALCDTFDAKASTIHRYLATLVLVGLAEQDSRTRGYRLAMGD